MTLTLTIKQLSYETNLAIKTIRTTLVRNPAALPPRLVIPGQKKLLWLRSDVEDFYGKQKRMSGSNPDFSTKQIQQVEVPEPQPLERKRKPGAPTKVERLAKLQEQNKE
jgi:hypothetical protein